jgi:hypothetical protein
LRGAIRIHLYADNCVAVGAVHGEGTFKGKTPVPDVVVVLTLWLTSYHVMTCRWSQRDVLGVEHVATIAIRNISRTTSRSRI